MFDLPSIKPKFITPEMSPLSRSERVIYWTIILTPLWWLLGIQPLFYPALVIGLLAIHFSLDHLIQKSLPNYVWAWLAMSIAMLWTAALGIDDMGFDLMVAAAAVVTFAKSYFLIFACLALPFFNRLRVEIVTRAIAWMSAGYLVTISIQVAMLILNIGGDGYTPPLARLLPGDKGSLRVMFADLAPFFGVPLPRTVLYTPDPPILGLCSLLCFLICLGERDQQLRRFALLGAVAGLTVSASRSAWICLPIALLVGACLESGLFRQLSLWSMTATLMGCSIFGLTIEELLRKPAEGFTQVRASSSQERAIVVRETLEAWQQSPWIGWGVIRGKAHLYEDVYITLGSFSTYAAVLYLNGIVGFIALIAAMLLTLFAAYATAIRGSANCKWAFAGLIALYIACNATPLSWMAVNLWFFFVWLGAVLCEAECQHVRFTSWDQLSGQG
ncbi:O-antigen ligase family protein [Leptolyngbya sp. DQ-M1]|uniref:O-antigen ligase family protein n=1 Tax=Leptolyngbya sp. DQ-M1 TaxID=2933920 RepID=UPI00329842CC